MVIRAAVVLVVCAFLAVFVLSADAQVDDIPLIRIMPDLRTAPAPNWVRQGVRMTYWSAVASIPGTRYVYEEDENGEWEDKAGKHYSPREIQGLGVGGYTQIDVVALDGASAVIEVTSFGLNVANNRVSINGAGGAVGYPGAGGDWWLSPQVLARVENARGPGFRILRMPYVVQNTTFNAIRFQVTASGFNAWNYDLETGILLHMGTSSIGTVSGPRPVGEGPATGTTMITLARIMSVRTPTLPWASSPAPDWVGRTRVLRYEGQVTISVPGASTLAPARISVTFERQSGGRNWGRYIQAISSPLGSQRTVRVAGPAQVGGLWVHPSVLRQLRSGQVLDTDSITSEVVSVGQIGRTPQGHEVVGIRRSASGFRTDAYYSLQDGVLVSVVQDAPTAYMHSEVTLVGRQ
jgi:hypothetical protein